MKSAVAAALFCALLLSSCSAADPATSGRLACRTADGRAITYEIEGLGAPNVVADARIGSTTSSISSDIARRQHGDDRPFAWDGSLFDRVIGNYESNPSHRNWAGSDLSGGSRIFPGGVGDVNVRCTDRVDCISKKHDIEFWLAANIQAGCRVTLLTRNQRLNFTVASLTAVNTGVVGEFLGLVSPEERLLLDAVTR